MADASLTRREILAAIPALGLPAILPAVAFADEAMPMRRIPGSNESLAIIGLGSSKPVDQIAERGAEPLASVLRALVASGGNVVDTWPRNADNDAAFGTIIEQPDLRDALFVASKIDRTGREEGIRQFEDTLRHYRRDRIDLLQVFSLTDLDTQWRNLQDFREQGRVRYLGVTVSTSRLYDALTQFLRREKPDFVQVNYSISEREAEQRMLPLLQDNGVAVIINRPFMNGALFEKLAHRQLPAWAAEFDCTSWAEFSLKYILPHAAITCVLTETSNPEHMRENAGAALGLMPDQAQRRAMAELIDSL
ncbi:MAG: aldo/keto reductase [Gammaproteobacteria bacterium]|nr:aldo/keto reductase [Gammaproteobacteria bacterium]MDH5304463.1 aldo/keto reductase [Gammaproteobacteria bacterium]MDH5321709.1 aldo/keto reductase [Gammaproteobacteria bacterium]